MAPKEIIIKDNGFTTKLYVNQGLDLVIEQTAPNGNTTFMQHYSNPGVYFFATLLKFLHNHNIAIPKFKVNTTERDQETSSARMSGFHTAIQDFPFEYSYYHDASANVDLNHDNGTKLILTLNGENRQIVISPRVAQELVQKIPTLYPYTSAFHHVYNSFMDMVKTNPDVNKKRELVPEKKELREKPKLMRKRPI